MAAPTTKMDRDLFDKLQARARQWAGADCLVATYTPDAHTMVTVFNNNRTDWMVLRTFMVGGKPQISCDITSDQVQDIFQQLECVFNE